MPDPAETLNAYRAAWGRHDLPRLMEHEIRDMTAVIARLRDIEDDVESLVSVAGRAETLAGLRQAGHSLDGMQQRLAAAIQEYAREQVPSANDIADAKAGV